MSDFGLQKSIADARIAVQSEYSLSSALERGLPYFGRQLAAFQSPPVRYALLAQFARSALRGKATGNILEVGSWAGASALTFGSVLQELGKADGHILCIDRWEKYFEAGDRSFHYVAMNDAIATGEIETLFRHNVRVCGLEDMVQVRKADSRKTLPELDGDAFDLVYIDGSHKKDDVVHDVREAKRLVRQGGVICGDDLEALRSEVDPAAHQLALSRKQDFVVDPLSGRSYHPGVTEAVAALFPNVWHQCGFWCVERVGEDWKLPTFHPDNLEIPFHLRHAVEIPYGVVHGYEVFQLGDGFVAYPMDSPYWFQSRIAGGCLEEIVVLLEAIEHMERTRGPRLFESRHGFNIVSYRGKIWAVDQSVGTVDFRDEEQLRYLAASGRLLEAGTMGEAKSAVDTKFIEDLVARMENGQASLAQRLSLIAPGPGAGSRVLEEYHGYSLIAYAGRVWAVAKVAGPMDFTNANMVKVWEDDGRLVWALTMDGARAAVDRIRDRRAIEGDLENAQRRIHARLEEVEARVAQERDAVNERTLTLIRALDANLGGPEGQLRAESEATTREISGVAGMKAKLCRKLAGLTKRLDEHGAASKRPWWRRMLGTRFNAGKEEN